MRGTAEKMTIYERAVDISNDYLGPAGERFIRKQIAAHLDKEPEQLGHKDITTLVTWVRPTLALLTDNAELIDTFSERLMGLSRPATKNSKDAVV